MNDACPFPVPAHAPPLKMHATAFPNESCPALDRGEQKEPLRHKGTKERQYKMRCGDKKVTRSPWPPTFLFPLSSSSCLRDFVVKNPLSPPSAAIIRPSAQASPRPPGDPIGLVPMVSKLVSYILAALPPTRPHRARPDGERVPKLLQCNRRPTDDGRY